MLCGCFCHFNLELEAFRALRKASFLCTTAFLNSLKEGTACFFTSGGNSFIVKHLNHINHCHSKAVQKGASGLQDCVFDGSTTFNSLLLSYKWDNGSWKLSSMPTPLSGHDRTVHPSRGPKTKTLKVPIQRVYLELRTPLRTLFHFL